MNNEETLQNYNSRLTENNNDLNTILTMINELPEAKEDTGETSQVIDVYSTSETITNKIWIDNKPIYRKVIKFTQGLNGGVNEIAHNIADIDSIVDVNMLLKFNTTVYFNSAFESTSAYISLSGATPEKIFIGVGSSWGNSFKQGFTIIMEYTKTTD